MNHNFLFNKQNYTLLLIGIAVIALGFLLMNGSRNDNPNEFNAEIFSFRRVHLSSALVLLGMGISFYSIFKKEKNNE